MGKHWGSVGQYRCILAILFILSACMKSNKTIIVAMPSQDVNSTLDPSQLWLSDRYVLMDNLSAKLVHINARNDYELLLAENISVSKSGTDIEIKLKDARFSDGSPITADDVSNSFKRLILKGSAHIPLKEIVEDAERLSSLHDNITGLTVLDRKTLRIRLKQRTKEIIYYFSLADMGIVHKSLLQLNEIRQIDWKVVSGAYSVDGDFLVKNNLFIENSADSPERVTFINPPLVGSQSDLSTYDIGYSGFLDKSDNRNAQLIAPYKYTSGGFNNLTYLVLNTKRPIFSDLKLRQKIQKLISQNFFPGKDLIFFKKANQFFLPDSFAFQKKFTPHDLINESFEKIQIPDFTVLATTGTKKYTTPNMDTDISSALKNRTVISFSDDISVYKNRKKERDFDAYLVPTSMSYNVVTESLNLLYRSDVRFGNNPNGKIVQLIEDYQKSEGTAPDIVEKIIREMTLEAEVIPLLYVSSPKFYNSDRLDISEMNTAESLTFWKLRVK